MTPEEIDETAEFYPEFWAGRLIGNDQAWDIAEEIIESQKKFANERLKEAFKAGQAVETSAEPEHFDDNEFDNWISK